MRSTLFAAENLEQHVDAGMVVQNPHLLKVRLVGDSVLARQGSMVAYQGDVHFEYQGGGAAKFFKKAFTGEGVDVMKVSGSGDVFLADEAMQVFVVQLEDEAFSVNGRNVLAFSTSLHWDIKRIEGAGMMAGGLFNTVFTGSGDVAVVTHGRPLVLDAGEAPTFVDTNAVVAWSASLQTTVRRTFKAAAMVGRGSGEAVQLAFAGQGFVVVQPSEGIRPAATG